MKYISDSTMEIGSTAKIHETMYLGTLLPNQSVFWTDIINMNDIINKNFKDFPA